MKQSAVVMMILGAVAAALYAVFTLNEPFWNLPARAVKVDQVYTNNGVDFWQTPNFQGVLSPRFSNTNYGPYIKADLPAYNNMAVPANPLGGNRKMMEAGVVGISGMVEAPVIDISEGFDFGPENVETMGMVPATGGLLATYVAENGEPRQAISYNRYMYANKNSRLRAQGDPIRGDLPIVPATGNWFVPSVHPNIDLKAGAMNVMGGVNNRTSNQLAHLIYATSGGSDTTIGGVDLAAYGERSGFAQMNNYSAISGGADVTVTSFP